MNLPFEAIRSHFPDTVSISREELLQWIGRGDLIPDTNFDNMDRWNKYQRCGSNNDDAGGCYWDAVEVWFWPLK